jgi:hypothetical protein
VSKKAKAREYVIAREAEIDLNNLLNKLEVSGYSKESLLQELDDISVLLRKAIFVTVKLQKVKHWLMRALHV